MNRSMYHPIRLSSGKIFRITPDFLNSVLVPEISADQATIITVRPELLTGDTHFNAVLYRLHLTYDRPTASAPGSLIAKLPTTREELYERAGVFQPGARENWFYRTGASSNPVHVPHCYLNDIDPSTGESVLLLEDLAPASPGSWLSGATKEQVKLALTWLASLHAYWWDKADSREIQELNQILTGSFNGGQDLVQELYDSAWPIFLDRWKHVLPVDVRQFGSAILSNMKAVDTLIDLGPKTLAHGDFRLDNVLFGSKDGKKACWFIDWEDVFWGNPLIDVSWFLGGCLPVKRSSQQINLLRYYHQALLTKGVENYDWTQCYQDYRRSMCSSFVQGVLSATPDESVADYNVELSHMIAGRFITSAQQLHLRELMLS